MDGNIWQKEASVTGDMAAMFPFQTATQPSQRFLSKQKAT